MSLVLQSLREKNDYTKKEGIPLIGMSTGFDIYDFMNSSIEEYIDGTKIINGGLFPNYISFIGKSMSGKTSFAVKLSANVIQKFTNGTFFFRDAEKTTSESRFFNLTGWDLETYKNKCDYRNTEITHDSIFNEIKLICQHKESLKDKLLLNTGLKNRWNQPIMYYPPTVYLVDSLAVLNPVDDDGLGKDKFDVKHQDVLQRTEGMVAAGSNKQLLNKLGDYVKNYNIILILINHITTEVATGFNKSAIPKQMTYLKQGEKLPGGASYLYGCFNIIRTDYSNKIEDNEWGSAIYGTINRLTMIKNKNNISGVPVELIFDQNTGYNGFLSNWNYLFNRRYGFDGGTKFTLKCGSKSFTKKTLWELAVKDLKETGGKELVAPMIYTARKCLFYDMILHRPDPNPNNWNGTPTRLLDTL